MLRKYLLCLLAVCAVSNAQSTPPTQQTQRGRGGVRRLPLRTLPRKPMPTPIAGAGRR